MKDPEQPKKKKKEKKKKKRISRKKNRAGGIRLLVVRQYYKATVIKTVWYKEQYGTKPEIQISGIGQSPEINPHTYGQLSQAKEARIYNGEKTVSSINSARRTGQLHGKE